jgi:hypothetical protein
MLANIPVPSSQRKERLFRGSRSAGTAVNSREERTTREGQSVRLVAVAATDRTADVGG